MTKDRSINLTRIILILLVIKTIFSKSIIIPLNGIIDNGIVGLFILMFILMIIKETMTLKQLLIFVGFGLIILFTCFVLKEYNLLITFLTIYTLKNQNLDEISKFLFQWNSVFIMLHVILSIIVSCVSTNYSIWIYTDDRYRFNAGFVHPNVFASFLMSIILMYLWYKYETVNMKDYLIIFLINIISLFVVNSRTSFALVNIILVLHFLFRRNCKKEPGIERIIGLLLFPFLCIFSFGLIKRYTEGHAFILFLDNILTGRIRLGAYAYTHSGITMLPKFIEYAHVGIVQWDPYWRLNTFNFDNIYNYIFCEMGIIWFPILLVLIYKVSKKDSKICLFMIIWMLYGVTEVHGTNCFEFFPTLIFMLLLKKEKESDATNKLNYSSL